MRCLTLADELRKSSADISFVAREMPENLCESIERKEYQFHQLPKSAGKPEDRDWEVDAQETQVALQRHGSDPDWLIVDHYLLDERWEQRVRPFVRKIMVIDDLANRRHACDILLDQNLFRDMTTRYEKLVPAECKLFLGPRYALLRPEFRNALKSLRHRDGMVRRILISFGGSDPTNETKKALDALSRIDLPGVAVDVVVGSLNPHKEMIRRMSARMPNVTYHCQVQNMAQLMVDADLAIGAGGTATWERCSLGLPCVMIVIADNQAGIADAVAAEGAAVNLKWYDNVSVAILVETLTRIIKNPELLREMSKRAFSIMTDEGLRGSDHPLLQVLIGRSHAEA
jgi:UDP-2,4-diacetamido-2,4,6-trideoxy-beta-L-altropyranose hydrolase